VNLEKEDQIERENVLKENNQKSIKAPYPQ
jgi:hypothetical protein